MPGGQLLPILVKPQEAVDADWLTPGDPVVRITHFHEVRLTILIPHVAGIVGPQDEHIPEVIVDNSGREHIVAVWRSNGGNEVILSIRNLTLRVGGGLRPYAGHLIISHGDAPMYAVIGNPQPDFGPNASALVIRPVPIGHHGIVFRVIDHISVAVVVAGAGRLRLNGIGKPLRFYPMHSVAGGNDGRVFVDGDPHHVGRINGPIAIAVPRFLQDNYVRVSHLVIGMRTVAVIGGKILISGGLVQCGLAGVCRKRRGWK